MMSSQWLLAGICSAVRRKGMLMTHLRRLAVAGSIAAGVVMAVAAAAWACIPVATLQVSPVEVEPGQEVAVTGTSYGKASDVVLRFDTLDGPALATLTPSNGHIEGRITVPQATEPGDHVIIATQEAVVGETTWGVPSRALVTVVGPGGAPIGDRSVELLADGQRSPGLVSGTSVGTGELLLVALGTAGVAMFLAGGAALVAGGRRRAVTESARR